MIPSPWFRRVLLAMFFVELGSAILWLASWLAPNPADHAFAQTVASIVFLIAYYSGTPLAAKFLAPYKSENTLYQIRLESILAKIQGLPPVTLYDHPSA